MAVVLGLAGGGAAVGLFKLIGLITHLTLLHDVGSSLPTLRGYHPSVWLLVPTVGGGLIVALFAVWAPVIRGHGIPESLEAILSRDSKIRPRAAVAKPLSAAITIGTGGPFGAEGPIIVTGGSIGSLVGQVLAVSPAERKIMLATGAAAGMSATFNTPLAAVILAIELVLFERSLRTIVPLLVACSIAAGIHVAAFGSTPLFAVSATLHVGVTHLPLFAVVGLAAGVLAVILNKGLFAMEAMFRKLPVSIFWWPAIGALGFASIGLLVPRTLSMGYSAISDTLNGRFTVTALAVLCLAKLMSWWIALGSQTSGGTLAPMFLIGATMGSLLGNGVNYLWPGLHVSPSAFALVAMGATFGAATKAVFASVVFAAEVTGQYQMAAPLMIAVAVAELVAEVFLTDRLMTEKLSHRGFRVDFRTEVDALRMRVARQVMRKPVFMPADTSVAEASQALLEEGRSVLTVVDAGRHYLGMVSARQLRGPDAPVPATPVGALARKSIPAIGADDFLATALDRLTAEGVEGLPVVEADRVVGQLDLADIAAERHRHHTVLETPQVGWITVGAGSARRRARARRQYSLTSSGGDMWSVSSHARRGSTSGSISSGGRAAIVAPDRGAGRVEQRGTARSRPRARVSIVPVPAQMSMLPGEFTLSERSRIVVAWDSAQARPVAEELATWLRPATGYRLSVSDGRAYREDISLCLGAPDSLSKEQADEGYVLDAGWTGLTLTAATVHGLYNGVQTIRQLLPVWIANPTRAPGPWTVPAVHIVDYPRYSYRGMMLDISSHVMAPEAVMELIDRASAYKLDVLHLRLSVEHALGVAAGSQAADHALADRCVQDSGGGWTSLQYQQVVAHAARRFMTLVPEVDSPGYGEPDERAMCTAVIRQLTAMSPSPYYHLGGGGLPSAPRPGSRYATFVNAEAGMVNALGKTVMGWADIAGLATGLEPGSVAEYWHTDVGSEPATAPAAEAVAAGIKLVMAPAGHAYLDQKYPDAAAQILGLSWARETGSGVDDFYNWDPAGYITGVTDENIIGVEAVLWSHAVPSISAAEYLAFPRLLATAELAWSPKADRTSSSPAYQGFVTRLADHGARLTLAGVNFYPSPKVPWRLDLAGSAAIVHHGNVGGTIATLCAPGLAAERIAITVEWGDGLSTQGTLDGVAATPVAVNGVYSVGSRHTYRRAGRYQVTVTASAAGAASASATITLHVRQLSRLVSRRNSGKGNAATRVTRSSAPRPDSARAALPARSVDAP